MAVIPIPTSAPYPVLHIHTYRAREIERGELKRNVNFVASLELIYICGSVGDSMYFTLLYYSLETQVNDDHDYDAVDDDDDGVVHRN